MFVLFLIFGIHDGAGDPAALLSQAIDGNTMPFSWFYFTSTAVDMLVSYCNKIPGTSTAVVIVLLSK